MALFDVFFDDGCFCVVPPNGVRLPLRLGAEPVRNFQTGWRPVHVYAGFAPLYLLELVHDEHGGSRWWLDANMTHLATDIGGLDSASQAILADRISAVFSRLWLDVFHEPQSELSNASADFLSLSSKTRRDIDGYRRAITPADMRVANPEANETEHRGFMTYFGLTPHRLDALLGFDHQAHLCHYITQREIVYPSPFGDYNLRSVHSICLDSFRLLYCFYDPKADRRFYVAVTDHYSTVQGVVLTERAGTVVFCRDNRQEANIRQIMFADPMRDMLMHLCAVGAALPKYLRAAPLGIANLQRGEARHMGHMLWNELTGLLAIVEGVPAARMPYNIVPDAANGGEIYGPVDAIFPEFAGKAIRHLANSEDVASFAYASKLCVVRSARLTVTEPLRQRIRRQIEAMPEMAAERERHLGFLARNQPIVVLGLRTENRAPVDLFDFYRRVVEILARRLGPVTIIVDGHNLRGSDTRLGYLESNRELIASRSPVEIEREILHGLQEQFAGGGVDIVDMVGQPMSTNLFWIDKASMFVAPWGTGMAKYCWVCNKPGYVLTSPWNIAHRGDLNIYVDPTNQGVTGLHYTGPKVVRARPDAPVLIPVEGWPVPSYENFEVDYAELETDLMLAAAKFIFGTHSGRVELAR